MCYRGLTPLSGSFCRIGIIHAHRIPAFFDKSRQRGPDAIPKIRPPPEPVIGLPHLLIQADSRGGLFFGAVAAIDDGAPMEKDATLWLE